MPERSKSTVSTDSEQWTVVVRDETLLVGRQHVWRFVQLRNGAGRLSAGVQCVDCGLVERIADHELRRFGQQRQGRQLT